MDGRSLKSLGGRQRGVGGPWGAGGVVHEGGLNVGDRAGHLGCLGVLAGGQRRSPLAVPKAAANTMPPMCSLRTWTPSGQASRDQGCPHSADEETKSRALTVRSGEPALQPGPLV